jgi:hypothetical protein
VGGPAVGGGLGIYGAAVDVDLEVEVTTDAASVAGLTDGADALAGPCGPSTGKTWSK